MFGYKFMEEREEDIIPHNSLSVCCWRGAVSVCQKVAFWEKLKEAGNASPASFSPLCCHCTIQSNTNTNTSSFYKTLSWYFWGTTLLEKLSKLQLSDAVFNLENLRLYLNTPLSLPCPTPLCEIWWEMHCCLKQIREDVSATTVTTTNQGAAIFHQSSTFDTQCGPDANINICETAARHREGEGEGELTFELPWKSKSPRLATTYSCCSTYTCSMYSKYTCST